MTAYRFIRWTMLCLSLALAGCFGPTSAVTQLSVVAALGAIKNAQIDVYDTSGTRVMGGTTDANGRASMSNPQAVSGPVVVVVTLVDGSSYFDEGKNDTVTISANATNPPLSKRTLLSVLPKVGTSTALGATPLTNLVAKFAGVTLVPSATDPTRLVPPAGGYPNLTADSIYKAAAKVNMVLGLPSTFNVLAAPADVATLDQPLPTSDHGKVLAALAKKQAQDDPTDASPGLTQSHAMANAVITRVNADGSNNISLTGTTIKSAAGQIASPPATLNLSLATRAPVTDLSQIDDTYLQNKVDILKTAIDSGAAVATLDTTGTNPAATKDPVAVVYAQDASGNFLTGPMAIAAGKYNTISIAISDALTSIKSVVYSITDFLSWPSEVAGGTAGFVSGAIESISGYFTSTGTKTITATFKDATGATVGTATRTVTVNDPGVSQTASVTGAVDRRVANTPVPVSNGTATPDTTPRLSGTATPGLPKDLVIKIYDTPLSGTRTYLGSATFTTTTANGTQSTHWTYTPTTALAPGRHSFTAKVDHPGQDRDEDTANNTPWVIDILPTVTAVSCGDALHPALNGQSTTCTVTGTSLVSGITAQLGTVACTQADSGSDTAWSFTCTPNTTGNVGFTLGYSIAGNNNDITPSGGLTVALLPDVGVTVSPSVPDLYNTLTISFNNAYTGIASVVYSFSNAVNHFITTNANLTANLVNGSIESISGYFEGTGRQQSYTQTLTATFMDANGNTLGTRTTSVTANDPGVPQTASITLAC